MMDTASFSGVLRAIVIMVLAYYAIKFLLRIFAPIIMQKVVQKAGEAMHERQQQYYNAANQQQANQQPQPQPDKPREKKKVGEYIDFEEIN